MAITQLTSEEIIKRLDVYLDAEFSFIKSEIPAAEIVQLSGHQQDFVLNLVKRMAATNVELAYQFSCSSIKALTAMDMHMVEAWAMTATDNYDRKGLFPAMSIIRDLDSFVQTAHINACGSVFEEESSILHPFLTGLPGRKLKLAESEHSHTDTETIYLPPIMALLEESKDNFLIYKASIAFHWAQIQFGTFRVDIEALISNSKQKTETLKIFYALESIRLEACIKRELPGLYRDMQNLKAKLDQTHTLNKKWQSIEQKLSSKNATAQHSTELLKELIIDECPEPCCYQGIIQIDKVSAVIEKRADKEKAYFRVGLSEISQDLDDKDENKESDTSDSEQTKQFDVKKDENGEQQIVNGVVDIELDGELVELPDHMRELITSIIVDFGEIPPEYLYAAGPGEYDLKKYEEERQNPNDVWEGAYHEEGAELYNEWNFKRQHYHKNWCVLRELDITPEYNTFVDDTLIKYRGLLKSLRHTFEILRGEDKLLKRQVNGDDIDIDALVEAYGDVKSGMEMTDRLFTKMHKEERNVAVIFMVDMSGSTKGWINEAERESLILLAEVLEILGDRYAIYGFSGVTRKRCELYKIKSIDEDYDEEIKARIANIQPKDYTRMGVFIRHVTRLFKDIDASTKLMITLSDGKPDDYDTYRGEYGVEDTRQALYEAHRDGIHSFCITIDEEARDYLPHMYGAANYAVIDEVAKLPLKVSDIYRRLTT